MATLIKSNGVQQEVSPKNGTDYSLEELQGFVGGDIEIISVSPTEIMVLNEEGLIYGLPFNIKASDMFGEGGYVVGDVLICKNEEVK